MPEMKQTWRSVPGYEGIYSVSDFGSVMSHNYANGGRPRLLRQQINQAGYPQVWLYKNRQAKSFTVHRLVMSAFHGPVPEGYEINHKSGVKTESRLSNLEYVTSSQNRLHAFRLGIQVPAHGENHCRAKLTLADVIEIRSKIRDGRTQSELANLYKVRQSTISRVVLGQRWKRSLAGEL